MKMKMKLIAWIVDKLLSDGVKKLDTNFDDKDVVEIVRAEATYIAKDVLFYYFIWMNLAFMVLGLIVGMLMGTAIASFW